MLEIPGSSRTKYIHATTPIILIAQMFCSPTYFTQPASDKNRGWRAAAFRGLTIGKSSHAGMLRVLGQTLSSVPSADQEPPSSIIWNDFVAAADRVRIAGLRREWLASDG